MSDERSRADIILDEIHSGGFAICELDNIINACVKEIENIERQQ